MATSGRAVVKDLPVTIRRVDDQDFVSLTDIARLKETAETDDVIRSWLRNRNTIEFLGVWEQLNNPSFNPVEFDGFRKQAGLNSFTLTAKQWIERTGAIPDPAATAAPSLTSISRSNSPPGSRSSSNST
jgi:hypothetical protein